MVELFEQDIRKNDRQSSKGNQLKWENAGIWYKADYTGYEGLSEYIISHLLKKSTLTEDEFVLYELEEIRYKSNVYRGVRSQSFLREGWQIITLERLFHQFFEKSLYKALYQIGEVENRLDFLVEQVDRLTGLKQFGVYLNKLLTLDAFFLNEDRHTHNIAVLMDGKGKFEYCPIYDNGAALLADTTMDYPLKNDVYEMMGTVRAKTLCSDFDEQLNASETANGVRLKFNFTRDDVNRLLEGADIYYDEEKDRVRKIIFDQMRKYQYLFSNQQ